MPWFDFFDEDEAERKRREAERRTLPTVEYPGGGLNVPQDFKRVGGPGPNLSLSPTVEIPPSIMGGEQKPQGPTPFKGMISEEQSGKLQKRNAIENDVKNRAIKIINRALAAYGLKPGESLPDSATGYGEVGAASADPIYRAPLGNVSKTARAILQKLERGRGMEGIREYENELRDLENTESQSLRVEEVTPREQYSPGPEKLADVNAKVLKAQDDLRYAVSEEQRKALQATIDSGLKIINSVKPPEQEKGGLDQSFIGEPETPESAAAREAKEKATDEKAARDAAFHGDDGTPGRDSVWEVFGSLSQNGRKEFTKQASNALNKIADILPDPMARVSFYVALPAIAEHLGEQAYNRVVTPLAQLQQEWNSIDAKYKGQQQKLDEQGQATSNERKAKLEQEKKIVADLANNDILNTPLGVIGFILTSLVLGPKMAAFVFTRSATRGKLQAELMQTRQDIADLRERESSLFQMQNRAAGQALESEAAFRLASGREQTDTQRMRESKLLEHYSRMQEIKAAQEGRQEKPDLTYKELSDAFDRKRVILANAENRMERQEHKIAKLQERLSDPMLDKAMRAQLQKALQEETGVLNNMDAQRAKAEDDLAKIDNYIRNYGKSAGFGAASGAGRK